MTEKEKNRRKENASFLLNNKTSNKSISDDEKERRKKNASFLVKNTPSSVKSNQNPSAKNSGSGDIYSAGAQRARTNVDSRTIESQSINANKRMTGQVDMRADAESAAMAKKMQNMTEEQRKSFLNEYVTKKSLESMSNPEITAKTLLKAQQHEASKAWAQEKAAYNAEQAEKKARTVNTPMSEKYAMMSDEELKKSANDKSLGVEQNFASAEMTERYKDKFYSMSDEERRLVATVNAYSVGGARRASPEDYAKARDILKNEYGHSDDDITAMTYFYNRYANEQRAQKDDVDARLAMEEHPFLESVASVPMGLAGGVASAVGIAGSYADNKRVEKIGIEDQGLDYNHGASRLQRQTQSARDEFTDTHDLMIGDYDVGDMLYNTALSGLESATAAVIPGGAVLLGVNAGTSRANELAQRGVSSDKAIMGGVAAGTFEAVFEAVSIGNIKALKEVDARTIKDVALNVGKSMLTNFSEEAATEVANIVYDTAMHGDKSERQMQIAELVATGEYTQEEAEKEVLLGQILQVIEAGASGALMGAGFGAIGTGGSYIENKTIERNMGETVNENDLLSAYIAAGKVSPEGSRANTLAQKLEGKGKVSDRQAGALAYEVSQHKPYVSEGGFAGVESEAELNEIFENQKVEEAMNKERSNSANRKAMERLYTEYQKAQNELKEIANAKKMKEAYETELERKQAATKAELQSPTLETENGTVKIESDIYKAKDGENAVKTADGKEIKVSELITRMKDKTAARVYESAQNFSPEAANLFVKNYDGEEVGEYGRAFDYYYRMGRTGMNVADIRAGDTLYRNYLTEEAQAQIAAAGLKDREFKAGLTDMSSKRKNDRFKYESKVLQHIGEKRNLEFIILDESQRRNGYYLSSTNRIVVYRDADGGLLLRTAGHEAYHFIKDRAKDETSKAEVEALQNYVLDALKENGVDIEAEIARKEAETDEDTGERIYKTREDCVDEIVGDSMFEVFSNEKFAEKILNENRSLFNSIANKIKQILADIKAAIAELGLRNNNAQINALKDDAEKLEQINTMFHSLLEKAGDSYKAEHTAEQKNNADQAAGDVKFSYKGKTEDGRSIYKTNYIKGTPKSVKQQDLIELVQNIWSEKPITLDVIRNGKPQKIVAQFNPELTERSDLSKLAFGNRKGTASDQRITLDLASDFYQIAEESKYTKSKEETGKKDNPAHDGVFNWDYFVTNLIYQDENDNNIECYMNIDVKEKSDGHFFYSFAIKKGTAPQTLDAVVTDESATVPIDSIPEVKKSVKQENPITLFNIRTARENKVFRQIFTLLDDMAYSGIEVKKLPSEKDIRTQAKGLLSKYNSKYSEKELTQELAVIYDYMMQNINNNLYKTEDFYNNVTFLAKKVIDKCTVKNTTLYDDNAEIRKILRSTPIYISPQLESEIISQFGDYKTFRNMLMGNVMHLTKTDTNATPLDVLWKEELATRNAGYFPADTVEKDMPLKLAEFYKAIAPTIESTVENAEISVSLLAGDIIKSYSEINFKTSKSDVYKEYMKNHLQSVEKQMDELKKKLVEDSNKELNERISEYRTRKEEAERRRVVRNKLMRNRNYISNRLKKNENFYNIPEKFKPLAEALLRLIPDDDTAINSDVISTVMVEVNNKRLMLEGVAETKDLVSDSLVNSDGNVLDEIYNELKAFQEKIKVTNSFSAVDNNGELPDTRKAYNLDSLTNSEIEMLNDIFEMFKHSMQTDGKLLADKNKASLEETAEHFFAETQSRKDDEAKTRELSDRASRYISPQYLFKRASPTLLRFFENLKNGENTVGRIMNMSKDAWVTAKKQNHYDARWKTEEKEIKLRQGKINLSVMQIMSLYAYTKQEDAREHLLNGGMTIEQKSKKGISTIRKTKTFNLVEEDFKTISDALSENQKKYIDDMVNFLSTDIARERNIISMALYGIKKYKMKYYFPMIVDRNYISRELGRPEAPSSIKNQGSAHQRVKGAKQPLTILGFDDVVAKHIHESAAYCAYVLPLSDMKRIVNYSRVNSDPANGIETLVPKNNAQSVKSEIKRVAGERIFARIERFLQDADSGVMKSQDSKHSAKMLSMWKKSLVQYNASVVVQQPISYFRAAMILKKRHMVSFASKEDIAEMERWNGCATIKKIGRFDVNIGGSDIEWLQEYKTEESIKKEWTLKDRTKNFHGIKAIDEFGGFFAEKADQITWGAIWVSCKKQTKAENPGLEGDALYEEAARLFQKVITETQVYDSVFSKCEALRSNGGIDKLSTAFMAEPLVSLNLFIDAKEETKNLPKGEKTKGISKVAKTAAIYVVASFCSNLNSSFIQALFRDDDEEKGFLEKFVPRLLDGWITDPLGLIPMADDIVSAFKGYDLTRTDLTYISSITNMFKKSEKALETFQNADATLTERTDSAVDIALEAAKVVSYLSGFPFGRISQTIYSVFNKFKNKNLEEPNTLKGVTYALWQQYEKIPFVPDAPTNYEQLYEAMLDNDQKHFEKVYDNLLEGGKAEKDIESKLRTEIKDAYKSGELSYQSAAQYMRQHSDEDKTDDDIYWELYEAKSSAKSRYDKLDEAIKNGYGINVDYLLEHGVEEETIKRRITSVYKDKLLSLPKGSIEYNKLYESIVDAYVAAGDTESKAKKKIKDWYKN